MNKPREDYNPKEIPTRKDPGDIYPIQDPDLKPGKVNPHDPQYFSILIGEIYA